MGFITPNLWKRVTFRALLLSLAMLCMCGVAGFAARKSETKQIDRQANVARARQLVVTAEKIEMESMLLADILYKQAQETAYEDSEVKMSVNNFLLRRQPQNNPMYYPQLELLEKSENAPMAYYYTLAHAQAPDSLNADSLAFYRTAVKAYQRFPKSDIFIDHLLRSGINFLFDARYVEDNYGEITDTLDLSPSQQAFADTLLMWIDRIETVNGYSSMLDRGRASLYKLLENEDGLDRLVQTLESRDSTDIETLDLLTSIHYSRGDSLEVSRLGLRRFELDPDGEHVYTLYKAMANDSIRMEFAEAVLVKAVDTDLDPQLRVSLLGALANAYYETLDTIPDNTVLAERMSNALREITQEDPNDEDIYLQGVFLARSDHWFTHYGYRHWMDATLNIPDSTGTQYAVSGVLAGLEINDNELTGLLKSNIDYYEKVRPDLVMGATLALGQHLFNRKKYEETIELLKPITIDDLSEDARLRKEYEIKEGTDTVEDSESEDDYMSRWVTIQSIISESYMGLDRVDDALAVLNQIIAVQPDNAEALNNLAYYMCIHGRDLTIAQSLVDRSLDINPANMNALDTRAWINYRQGKYSDAMAYMAKFFNNLSIDLYKDLIFSENAYDVLDSNTNMERTAPILAHLILIMVNADHTYLPAAWRLADIIAEIVPDNEDLKEFLDTYERPESRDAETQTDESGEQ